MKHKIFATKKFSELNNLAGTFLELKIFLRTGKKCPKTKKQIELDLLKSPLLRMKIKQDTKSRC